MPLQQLNKELVKEVRIKSISSIRIVDKHVDANKIDIVENIKRVSGELTKNVISMHRVVDNNANKKSRDI